MLLYETNQNLDMGKSACTIGQLSKGSILFFSKNHFHITFQVSLSHFCSHDGNASDTVTPCHLSSLEGTSCPVGNPQQVRAGWGDFCGSTQRKYKKAPHIQSSAAAAPQINTCSCS